MASYPSQVNDRTLFFWRSGDREELQQGVDYSSPPRTAAPDFLSLWGEALDTTNMYSLISLSVWFYVIIMFYDCLSSFWPAPQKFYIKRRVVVAPGDLEHIVIDGIDLCPHKIAEHGLSSRIKVMLWHQSSVVLDRQMWTPAL
ncbi:hypothetical protein V3C99_018296 [Haemonchus contortus]|uniref:Phospholipase D n=1 Tax=Haemonchus contortus TaxID=6289 RepID=A0A7I4Z2L6_HAECO